MEETSRWLSLVHDAVSMCGAVHGFVCVWPSFAMTMAEIGDMRIVIDSRWREVNLGVPLEAEAQSRRFSSWRHKVGRTYARFPRWGTYLHAEHLDRIGGVQRIREVVGPARIDRVGPLTYIQLTDSLESAMDAVAGQRPARRARAPACAAADLLIGVMLHAVARGGVSANGTLIFRPSSATVPPMRSRCSNRDRRQVSMLVPVGLIAALLVMWAPPLQDAPRDDSSVSEVQASTAVATAVAQRPHDGSPTAALTELEDDDDDSDCDRSSRPCSAPRRAGQTMVHRHPNRSTPVLPFWLSAFPARAPPAA